MSEGRETGMSDLDSQIAELDQRIQENIDDDTTTEEYDALSARREAL